jgi:hypothetical protein
MGSVAWWGGRQEQLALIRAWVPAGLWVAKLGSSRPRQYQTCCLAWSPNQRTLGCQQG